MGCSRGWMDSAAAGSGRRGGGGGAAEAGGGGQSPEAGGGGRIRSARRRRGSRRGRRGRPEPRGRRGRPEPRGRRGRADPVGASRRPYHDFQKEWRLQLNDFTGAVYEGRLYGPDDFAQLESMPTRAQSYQYLLGCLQMPAVNVLAALRARQEAMAQGDKPDIEEAAVPAPAAEK